MRLAYVIGDYSTYKKHSGNGGKYKRLLAEEGRKIEHVIC